MLIYLRHLLLALGCALFLIACNREPPTVIAEINFADAQLPGSVAEISGFFNREPWGRWSNTDSASSAKIRFKQALPTQFSITIKGQTVPGGNEYPIIKVGKFEESFHLKNLKNEAVIDVIVDKPTDTIEFVQPDPVSPKSLGLNNDARKLGVGLATLKIEK